ncbi:hypothetical protein LF599_02145 [Pseudodesulfovibrio thermohalotolerans]|uniref:hypothetical protein n=1 Tax=Pseudodesulfovibrio thermohalotolerans TaxID=2880651 RepID=UPI0024413C18|nr:hypothetical protein [Pseudodesulfovibrio thermohalotolerans]WFS62986.1 hypothetical protein LF599_02145 [Pseudodesulfovibrio thermohalotolerans]
MPKILRAAELAQGPFLVLFWASKKDPLPAQGMEAGEGEADPTGSHSPNKLAHHPAKTLPPPQPSSCRE